VKNEESLQTEQDEAKRSFESTTTNNNNNNNNNNNLKDARLINREHVCIEKAVKSQEEKQPLTQSEDNNKL
jgi:hypothetical protein